MICSPLTSIAMQSPRCAILSNASLSSVGLSGTGSGRVNNRRTCGLKSCGAGMAWVGFPIGYWAAVAGFDGRCSSTTSNAVDEPSMIGIGSMLDRVGDASSLTADTGGLECDATGVSVWLALEVSWSALRRKLERSDSLVSAEGGMTWASMVFAYARSSMCSTSRPSARSSIESSSSS